MHFLISSLPEQEILYRVARSSLLWLNLEIFIAPPSRFRKAAYFESSQAEPVT